MATRYFYGTSGNDVYRPGATLDTIVAWGFDGNDTLVGSFGDDYLNGGAGNDWLNGGAGANTLIGGSGDDKMFAGNGSNYADGGSGNDYFVLGSGDNTVYGGSGNDQIYLGAHQAVGHYTDSDGVVHTYTYVASNPTGGNNYVDAGSGNDFVIANWYSGDDRLYGGSGDDFVLAGGGDDIVGGGVGNDYLFGDDGDDRINGGDGDDLIFGGRGPDIIVGGAGVDRMWVSGGDTVYTDPLDTIVFDRSDNGTARLTGATGDTHFDFHSLGDYIDNPDGTVTQGIARSDVTFDPYGRLHVDHEGAYGDAHLLVAGSPYHSGSQFDAGIASGHIVLSMTFDGGKG